MSFFLNLLLVYLLITNKNNTNPRENYFPLTKYNAFNLFSVYIANMTENKINILIEYWEKKKLQKRETVILEILDRSFCMNE